MTDTSQPAPATPISNIVDADLRDASGSFLGVVDELLIDLRSGRIEYVLAAGRGGRRLQFPWSSIDVEAGSFVLRSSRPRLVVDRLPHRRR